MLNFLRYSIICGFHAARKPKPSLLTSSIAFHAIKNDILLYLIYSSPRLNKRLTQSQLETDPLYPKRTILIAGGSGVIGRAMCHHFARHDWHVGIHYHDNQKSAEQTFKNILRMDGTAKLYQANIQDPRETRDLIQNFTDTHGQLNTLVWAIGTAKSQLLVKTSMDSWTDHLETNLTGCFNLLKAAAPIFQKQQQGSVVIVGSLSSIQGSAGQSAYASSKAGLIGLLKTVAKEWAPWNIRVNMIFPGWHSSPLSGDAFPDQTELESHLFRRTPAIENIAKAVYELALLKDVSGQTWNLDSRIW